MTTGLFSQHKTESDFGWYANPPEWRAALRKLYPVEWVAAHHRQDVTEEMCRAHAKRLKVFQSEFIEPRLAKKNG